MQTELDKIEKEESELLKKEKDIENKERMLMDHDRRHEHLIHDIEQKTKADNWGEDKAATAVHVVHQVPLVPHLGIGAPKPNIGEMIAKSMKDMAETLKNAKTGPAPDHKFHPFFPHGRNLFKPGAHPAHDQKNKDANKKDEGKKPDTNSKKDDQKKEEPKKDDKKPEEP